jgi:hypothetical protein
LATLAGGLITFGFVLFKARNDRTESEIAGGTRALFTLMEMWNETKQYQKAIVDPYRNRRDAWLNLNVGPRLTPELAFDTRDLTFLMRKAPQVLMSVLLEGTRYRLATYLVEEHRRLAVEAVWPKRFHILDLLSGGVGRALIWIMLCRSTVASSATARSSGHGETIRRIAMAENYGHYAAEYLIFGATITDSQRAVLLLEPDTGPREVNATSDVLPAGRFSQGEAYRPRRARRRVSELATTRK